MNLFIGTEQVLLTTIEDDRPSQLSKISIHWAKLDWFWNSITYLPIELPLLRGAIQVIWTLPVLRSIDVTGLSTTVGQVLALIETIWENWPQPHLLRALILNL
jgi:hypothetical protein